MASSRRFATQRALWAGCGVKDVGCGMMIRSVPQVRPAGRLEDGSRKLEDAHSIASVSLVMPTGFAIKSS